VVARLDLAQRITFAAVGVLGLASALAFMPGWPVVFRVAGTCVAAALALSLLRLRRIAAVSPIAAAPLPSANGRSHAAVLAAMTEAVVATNAEGRVVLWNAAMGSLTSVDPNAAMGRRADEVLPFPRLCTLLNEVGTTGHATREEVAVPGSDAGNDAFDVQAMPLGPPGDRSALLVVRDLSRLRQLESLRREFVANVSHELKTPLSAIQGYCETLLDDAAMPEATRQRFLGRILRQTERLAFLVRDLLALSRIDDERGLALPAEPCDLVPVLRDCWRDLVPMGERKRHQMQLLAPPGPVLVRAERESLVQIALNLLENAIKYTPEGGHITMRLEAAGTTALLEVADNGIGLSPQDQQRVFERFYRVDKARTSEVEGTGLGLSIVKNTVLNLGGQVGVRSELGAGSTFWVRLPVTEQMPPPVADDVP
jgi:two-component system phosphate regulon sensor histidine kinase PhoR